MTSEYDDERAFREAVAAGDTSALAHLGALVSTQPGRQREAEAILRDAIAAGHTDAANSLGLLLAGQSGRAAEAEAAYREAIAAGNPRAPVNLAILLAQLGREDEAEQLYRAALAAGVTHAAMNLGDLLARQPGRGHEAEQLLRDALAAPRSDNELEFVALTLGDLLVRRGDVTGACAAFDVAFAQVTKRISAALGIPDIGTPSMIRRMTRWRIAIVRRPRTRRLAAAFYSPRIGNFLRATLDWERSSG